MHQPISSLARLYIYAIHGYVTEVMFTALWEFVEHGNWKFPGNTSIWCLFIYGLSTMVIEKLIPILKDKYGVPLVLRALIYTVWTYSWEFSTGYLLKRFGACPWDYEPYFNGHFMGLVTLEYAPLWYLGSIFCEKVLIKYTLQLHWGPESSQNGDVKQKVF